jgi:hypothetical protein
MAASTPQGRHNTNYASAMPAARQEMSMFTMRGWCCTYIIQSRNVFARCGVRADDVSGSPQQLSRARWRSRIDGARIRIEDGLLTICLLEGFGKREYRLGKESMAWHSKRAVQDAPTSSQAMQKTDGGPKHGSDVSVIQTP